MKRRSVTFTDSPPEIIDGNHCGSGTDGDNENLYTRLPTAVSNSNSFLGWLQLAKLADKQRQQQWKYVAGSSRPQQQQQFSRSVPDLSKQQYCCVPSLSTTTTKTTPTGIDRLNTSVLERRNPGNSSSFQHWKQRMDPIYRSIPNLNGARTRRHQLREAIFESAGISGGDDDSFDLWKTKGEERQKRYYPSLSDYCFRKRRTASAIIAVSPSGWESTDDVKDSGDDSYYNDDCDSNDIDSAKRIMQCKNFTTPCNVNASDENANASVDNDSMNPDNVDCDNGSNSGGNNSNVSSANRYDDSDQNEVKANRRKLAQKFLQRYYCGYKKPAAALPTAVPEAAASVTTPAAAILSKNWSLRNGSSGVSCFCYTLLNKQLPGGRHCQHFHESNGTTINTIATAAVTNISNSTKMRNVISSSNQQHCYHQPMYSKSEQQLVDEMAKHIAECLEQFNTGLDKVLQARQLLESSQDLPMDDRETMLRLLNQAMRTSRKRMECTDDRYDPDGRHSESPNSLPGQRQCAPVQQVGTSATTITAVSSGAVNYHGSNSTTGSLDPAEFFQQHGQQLLALLQQNMAKQN